MRGYGVGLEKIGGAVLSADIPWKVTRESIGIVGFGVWDGLRVARRWYNASQQTKFVFKIIKKERYMQYPSYHIFM